MLLDISISKWKEIIKFGQLVKYNFRDFFCKTMQKMCWRNYFLKKIKFDSFSELIIWSFKHFVFIVHSSQGLPKNIEFNLPAACFYFI